MDVVRIGTLGSARIAKAALFEAARHVPEATVAAVGARDLPRAEAYALQHGIAVAYGSYDELLADPGIDAIYNPLPNSLHGRWTLRAIAAGKHVLCEKPFASNAAEAGRVAAAAAASGLVVMEAMHYRYHPLIHGLREAVTSLGPVRTMQCWTSFVIGDPGNIRYDYALGGGALMDGGCYAIDCLRMLAGEPTVRGALADTTSDGRLVDRATAAVLDFPGGATGWFESAFTRDGDFRADLHVSCDGGVVHLDDFIRPHYGHLEVTTVDHTQEQRQSREQDRALEQDRARERDRALEQDRARERDRERDRAGETPAGETASWTSYVWQLRAFTHAIRAGGPVETSAGNAVATMRVIDETYRAASLPTR